MDEKDIHKIIDDAIAKKDRTVSIFISNVGTSIRVEPSVNLSRKDWIKIPYFQCSDDGKVHYGGYQCPECGFKSGKKMPYCPLCGEALKGE